ncbi:hypothetical protein [Actinoplanes sp. GCM10030250]|uniref:hypothetical protein n=1 Tax=Actinoplanes sp. GCM10030250 TaxID=3273376 RepID=UPI00361CDB0E
MLRARRLASAVVAASLAVGGLSACRSEPNVAAYIGDGGQVSEQRVQEVWDEVRDGLTDSAEQAAAAAEAKQRDDEKKRRDSGLPVEPAPTITAPPVQMPVSRTDVVRALVSQRLYAEVAERHQVSLPAGLAYDQVAEQMKLPAGSEFVRLTAQVDAYRGALEQAIKVPAEPAEQDLRMIYDRLAANGGIEPGQDFAAWQATVNPSNKQAVALAGAVRSEVETVVKEWNVVVNPRYHPFELNLLSASTASGGAIPLLSAEVGDDERAPVVDAS